MSIFNDWLAVSKPFPQDTFLDPQPAATIIPGGVAPVKHSWFIAEMGETLVPRYLRRRSIEYEHASSTFPHKTGLSVQIDLSVYKILRSMSLLQFCIHIKFRTGKLWQYLSSLCPPYQPRKSCFSGVMLALSTSSGLGARPP